MVGRPCSEEFRRRVLEEVAEGNSRRGAARRFKVGASSALEAHAPWLLALIVAEPDLSLAELTQRIQAERGQKTSASAMDRFVQRRGLSFKKETLHAAEQDRPDAAQAREAWKANLDPDKLAFIDETGAPAKMVRLRGRCRRGQRLLAKAPFGHWKTGAFAAGLRRNELVAPFILEGPMNGEAFRVYVEKILVPALAPDDIVVMDDLPAHTVEGLRKLIADAGAELRLPPAYSPDLNPIEMAFSQLKSHPRKAAERTVPALCGRIGRCLDEIAPQTCANDFAEAGYARY